MHWIQGCLGVQKKETKRNICEINCGRLVRRRITILNELLLCTAGTNLYALLQHVNRLTTDKNDVFS